MTPPSPELPTRMPPAQRDLPRRSVRRWGLPPANATRLGTAGGVLRAFWPVVCIVAGAGALIAWGVIGFYLPPEYLTRIELAVVSVEPDRALREHAGALTDPARWRKVAAAVGAAQSDRPSDLPSPQFEVRRNADVGGGPDSGVITLLLRTTAPGRAEKALDDLAEKYIGELKDRRDMARPDRRAEKLEFERAKLNLRQRDLLAEQKQRLTLMETDDPERAFKDARDKLGQLRTGYEQHGDELESITGELIDAGRPGPTPEPDLRMLKERYERDRDLRARQESLARSRRDYKAKFLQVMGDAKPAIEKLKKAVEQFGEEIAGWRKKGQEAPIATALKKLNQRQMQYYSGIRRLLVQWDDRIARLGEGDEAGDERGRAVRQLQTELNADIEEHYKAVGPLAGQIGDEIKAVGTGKGFRVQRTVIGNTLSSAFRAVDDAARAFRERSDRVDLVNGHFELTHLNRSIESRGSEILSRMRNIRDQLIGELASRAEADRLKRVEDLKRRRTGLEQLCRSSLKAYFEQNEYVELMVRPYADWVVGRNELKTVGRDIEAVDYRIRLELRKEGPQADTITIPHGKDARTDPEPVNADRRAEIAWKVAVLTFVLMAAGGMVLLLVAPARAADASADDRDRSDDEEYSILA